MTKPSIYHSQGYTCAESIIKSYNEEHNTEICKELKQNKISCSEIIDFSYDALNEVLES